MLLRLLAAPVRVPVNGALWLAGRIHETAESEISSPAALKAELAALERRFEAGEIDEAGFEEAETSILLRLRDAAARSGA